MALTALARHLVWLHNQGAHHTRRRHRRAPCLWPPIRQQVRASYSKLRLRQVVVPNIFGTPSRQGPRSLNKTLTLGRDLTTDRSTGDEPFPVYPMSWNRPINTVL